MKLKVHRGSPAATPRSRVIELGEWLLPANGDIDEFVSAVADHRGRPGHVLSSPLNPAGPSGFWIGIPTGDYIVVTATATPTRRAAIVCHELAHMLLGHEPEVGDVDSARLLAQYLAPAVDPSVAIRFLARHGYEASAEEDAEAAATAFVTAAATRQRATSATNDRVSERLR